MKFQFLQKRKEKQKEKKEGFSLPAFIIQRCRQIEIVFVILVLLSALAAPFVSVNYDKCITYRMTVEGEK